MENINAFLCHLCFLKLALLMFLSDEKTSMIALNKRLYTLGPIML